MTQEKQRVKRIYARMTPSEYLELQEQADAAALTISEFVRRRLFGRRIVSKVELRVLSELRKLGGLLKHIHNETGVRLREFLGSVDEYIIDKIDNALKISLALN